MWILQICSTLCFLCLFLIITLVKSYNFFFTFGQGKNWYHKNNVIVTCWLFFITFTLYTCISYFVAEWCGWICLILVMKIYADFEKCNKTNATLGTWYWLKHCHDYWVFFVSSIITADLTYIKRFVLANLYWKVAD